MSSSSEQSQQPGVSSPAPMSTTSAAALISAASSASAIANTPDIIIPDTVEFKFAALHGNVVTLPYRIIKKFKMVDKLLKFTDGIHADDIKLENVWNDRIIQYAVEYATFQLRSETLSEREKKDFDVAFFRRCLDEQLVPQHPEYTTLPLMQKAFMKQLTNAANYLDYTDLIMVMCNGITELFRKDEVEDIHAYMGLKQELTPAELEELDRQSEWILK